MKTLRRAHHSLSYYPSGSCKGAYQGTETDSSLFGSLPLSLSRVSLVELSVKRTDRCWGTSFVPSERELVSAACRLLSCLSALAAMAGKKCDLRQTGQQIQYII